LHDAVAFHAKQVEEQRHRLDESNSRLARTEAKISNMTLAHEKMRDKWSTEMKRVQDNIERMITDMKDENERLTKRNEELERMRSILEREKNDLRRSFEQVSTQLNTLALTHANERRRADELAREVRSMMDQHSELLREKKEMSVIVDRANLELEREKRANQSQFDIEKLRQTAPPRWTAPTEPFDSDLFEEVRGSSVRHKKKKKSTTHTTYRRQVSDEEGIPSSS
jgi:chromosome segregation ATPase